MTSHNINLVHITYLVGILWILSSLGACSWTPQVETELHNSTQGIVTLRTIKDNSLETDHPVEFTMATMERVLRGSHKSRNPRLIESLITNDDKPVHLFTQPQISFLAPLLISAFAQATQEEEVLFQCASEFERAPPIRGRMLVHDSTLFFTWYEPLSKPNVLAKQHRGTNGLMDPSMPQGHISMFFPNEALRLQDDSIKLYLKRLGENTLAIDYRALDRLPKSAFEIPELRKEDTESTAKGKILNDDAQISSEPRTSGEPTVPGSPKAAPDASSEIRSLREQIDKLQEEVDKQQTELNRLKKNKP